MKKWDQFTINDRLYIICRSENTRYGFRHVGKLYHDGQCIAEASKPYCNRTWERYTYQSLFYELHERAEGLTVGESTEFFRWIDAEKNPSAEKDMRGLGMIAGIAKMGDIFHAGDKSAANDWKARMLKAGLGDAISMPEDWPELSEKEKARRLDGAIKEISS